MTFAEVLWIYLAVMNILLYAVMGIDKVKAIRHKRRVPEATLFALCLLGGGVGGTLAMLCFRHKTKHMKFVIGFPVIMVLQLTAMAILMIKVNMI